MVYIYKKEIGGKPYYYLRVSERKGKKVVTKDLTYLGSSIKEVKQEIANLSEYKGDIRKAYKTIHRFLESNHYLERANTLKLKKDEFLEGKQGKVEACKLHYKKVFEKRDDITKSEILKNFVIEFAFNTTSIEGNTIRLKEVRNLLEEGKTPKDKTLREIYDLQNTEKVFFSLLETDEDLTHDFITKIHSKLMENIDYRVGYRLEDVRVIKARFDATPGPYVLTDMGLLLKWYQKNKARLHPLVLASLFHHKFEKIHPFMDGNGRTGRMLLNYILLKNDYPPLIVHKKARMEYLDVLGVADKAILESEVKGDYVHLVGFIADELVNYYWDVFL